MHLSYVSNFPFPSFCFSESRDKALEEAIKRRGTQRSIMQYSTFDWSNIPLSEEKRLAEQPQEQPRIVTVRFR